jgi:outer membrane protein, multidrug efflux system
MRSKMLLMSLAAFVFAGCSMAPNTQTPQPALPKKTESYNVASTWWKRFNDPHLDTLIQEALKHNDDLKLAVANVQKARAEYGISKADYYPQISLNASATRERRSMNAFPGSYGGIYNDFATSASISYELDFWGKIRNENKANFATFLATDADKESLRISIIADVATYYFNLLSINKQIEVAKASLQSARQILAYRQKQLLHGVVDDSVVAAAKAQVAQAESVVQTQENSKVSVMSALSLLLGRSPQAIFDKPIQTAKGLPQPIVIPAGIPSNILQHRPDIMSALEKLRASTALIGVAKAAYFPNITLTGSYGFESQKLNTLFKDHSQTGSIGPSLYLPIFSFGAIKSAVNVSKAEQKAALISYVKTVKTAYKEVYDSLGNIRTNKTKYKAMKDAYFAYTQMYTLAQKRYDLGTDNYLSVLTARQSVFAAEIDKIAAKAQVLVDEITLYKALGGGWNSSYHSKKSGGQ